MTDANKDRLGPTAGPRDVVAELRALLDKATPGPWKADHEFLMRHHTVTDQHGSWPSTRIVCMWDKEWDYQADQALIAALRNAAPELLDLADEALERREIMRTLRCDITLAEAKALETTQGTTLQILKERGL